MQRYPASDNPDIILRLTDEERWLVRHAIKIAWQVSSLKYLPERMETLVGEDIDKARELYNLLSEPEET